MEVSIEKVKQRIEARKVAEVAIGFVEETISVLGPEQLQHALSVLFEWVFERMDPKPKLVVKAGEPMSELEANEFEKKFLGFGRYQNRTIGMIPVSYLEWLVSCHEEDEMKHQLLRYVTCTKFSYRSRSETGE